MKFSVKDFFSKFDQIRGFLCSGRFNLGAMPTYTYFKVSPQYSLIFSTTPICIELLVIPNELFIFCSEVISTHKTNIDNNYQ